MRKKQFNAVILDRAYDDGKLAGFLGFETSEACPFGSDQPGPRIAWLDGFADGVWKGSFQVKMSGQSRDTAKAGVETGDRPDFETPDFETPDFETPDFETGKIAIAQVPHLSKVIDMRDHVANLDHARVAARFIPGRRGPAT